MVVLDDSSFLHAPKRVASTSYAPVPEPLLAAIAANDSSSFHAHVVQQCVDIDSFFVWTDPKTGVVCLRSLLMLASWYAATDVVAVLLSLGADVDVAQQSPDDQTTALHCACSNPSSSHVVVIRSLLNVGARLDVLDKHGRTARDLLLSLETAQASAAEDEMQKEYFKADDFRMYSFKVELCQRLEEQHDWTTCPFMHPGEKARRRDPRTHKYEGVPCPDFRKGSCKRGDACTYAHGVFECWLHPARYRTQLCKEGALCKRGVCFFAHSMDELREPLYLHGQPGDKAAEAPESPKGPLTPGGEASQDTVSSRSCSPDLAASRDSALSGSSGASAIGGSSSRRDTATSALCPAHSGGARPLQESCRDRDAKLRGSADSLRSVLSLSRSHSMGGSTESSLSSTPVVESYLARSLSNLSLGHEEAVAAAAAAAVAALGATSPSAACAANWGLAAGLQVHPSEMLSYQIATAGLLGNPGLQDMGHMLPNHAAVLQAAALQQRVALAQAPMDSASALLAVAGLRQPLQALSLNMGPHGYPQASAAYPSCFGV